MCMGSLEVMEGIVSTRFNAFIGVHWFVMWVDGTMHLWPSPWLYKGRFVLKSSESSRYQLKCECASLGSWVCIKSV